METESKVVEWQPAKFQLSFEWRSYNEGWNLELSEQNPKWKTFASFSLGDAMDKKQIERVMKLLFAELTAKIEEEVKRKARLSVLASKPDEVGYELE